MRQRDIRGRMEGALARRFASHKSRLPKRCASDIALTFDDGPSAITTPFLLEKLRALGVRATFFLVGELAERRKSMVSEIKLAGHCVASHGQWHAPAYKLTRDQVRTSVTRARATLEDIVHDDIPWFRPPEGYADIRLARAVRAAHQMSIGWSLNPRDYDPKASVDSTSRVLERCGPRDIVLMHEFDHSIEDPTRLRLLQTELEVLVSLAARRSLQFETISRFNCD